VLCRLALRASQAWDWFDKRQIDAHILTGFIAWGTWRLTVWTVHFAQVSDRPGMEVAAIIAAIMGPWSLLQGASLKFHFDTRQ
jgi:ribose/xylose/arabinose/galactoside ABC-type transport system permease subunit